MPCAAFHPLPALLAACLLPLAVPPPDPTSPLPTPPAIDPALLTVAERSGWQATARHADVLDLLDAIAKASPLARRSTLGTTGQGRDIPTLILSDPPVASARDARDLADREGRLIVLAIGNIHAGEVDGKEALPILARQLLRLQPPPPDTPDPASLLKHLIIILAPIYNPDGNELFGPPDKHRPGQNGPAHGMGIRENAPAPAGLDLNRDFVKLESPEGAALIRAFNDWDPHLFIDCHVTNGSFHRYLISYAGPKAPAGDPALNAYSRDSFLPALDLMFEAATPHNAFWYGSFEGAFSDGLRSVNAHSRWETFPAEARYGTTYVGLRNRLSLLVESYSYAPYHDRILGTLDFVRCALSLAAENRAAIRRLLADADARATRLGNAVNDPDDTIALRTKAAPWPDPVRILGYEEELRDGRIVSTGRHAEYTVELWDAFTPSLTITRPWGYLLKASPDTDRIASKLRQHGIAVSRLDRAYSDLPAEQHTVTAAEPASRAFQGHVLVRCDTTLAPVRAAAEPGDYLVRAGQPLGTLACYLLEPACEDGLSTWNYYDAWMHPGTPIPIFRLTAPIPDAP